MGAYILPDPLSLVEQRTKVNNKRLDVVFHYMKLNCVIFDADFVILGL